jgi:bifunctional polynucleotide phosphatase/kinase
MKVLFADLDGTLIKTCSGKDFPVDKDDWFIPSYVTRSIRKYAPDYLLIVTNQGGIGHGIVKEDDFKEKIKNIISEFKESLPSIKYDYIYCASNDKEDTMRKPNPGMVDCFIDQYKLDRDDCLMIGDASGKEGNFSDSDKKCAENAEVEYMDILDFIKTYA